MTDGPTLTRLCPPTDRSMTIRWDTVEADLGMPLPRDYKELAERYGPGRFCDYLSIFHPHGVVEFVNLTGPVPGRVRAHLRKDHDEGTFAVPYDPDQLFAIGSTDNGEYLFWITTPADPDAWHVAVNEARGPRWFTYDGNLTAFLAAVLDGRTQVPQFPADLLSGPRGFTPSHPTLWKPEPPTSHGPVDTAAIRAWAQAHGYDVPARGRIPLEVHEAWKQANRT